MENVHKVLANTTELLNAHLNALKVTRIKDKASLYILYRVVDESSFEKISSVKSSTEGRIYYRRGIKWITE